MTEEQDVTGLRDYKEINQAIDDHAVAIQDLRDEKNSMGVLYYLLFGLIQGKINSIEAENLLERLENFSDEDIRVLKKAVEETESKKDRCTLSKMIEDLDKGRRE